MKQLEDALKEWSKKILIESNKLKEEGENYNTSFNNEYKIGVISGKIKGLKMANNLLTEEINKITL